MSEKQSSETVKSPLRAPGADHPVRLRDRLREEAGKAILEAAEQVFSEEGLAARLDRVAARAGVAVGTLYNHFEDRGSLVAALALAHQESLVSRIDAAQEAAAALPFEAQLRAFVRAICEHARIHGRFLMALVEAGTAHSLPKRPLIDVLVDRANALVRRGVAKGALRPDPEDGLGLALVALTRAFLLRHVLEGRDPALSEDLVIELFLRGAGR